MPPELVPTSVFRRIPRLECLSYCPRVGAGEQLDAEIAQQQTKVPTGDEYTKRCREALSGIIAAIGEHSFGQTVLSQLNRWMPLCWLSIYRVFENAPPMAHALASHGVPDGTEESWRVYRTGLYKGDDSFSAAREKVGPSQTVVVHWNAHEMRPRKNSMGIGAE